MWQLVTIKMFLRSTAVLTNFPSRYLVCLQSHFHWPETLAQATAVRSPSFSRAPHSRLGENRCVRLSVYPSSLLIYS